MAKNRGLPVRPRPLTFLKKLALELQRGIKVELVYGSCALLLQSRPAATWLQPKLRDKRFPLQRPAGTWMGQTPSRRRAALKRSHGFRRRLAFYRY